MLAEHRSGSRTAEKPEQSGFSVFSGPSRNRTYTIGFGDRCSTTKLWTQYLVFNEYEGFEPRICPKQWTRTSRVAESGLWEKAPKAKGVPYTVSMEFARKALVALIFACAIFVPAVSLAATGPSDSGWHIIPDACKCENSAPDFGCVLQTTQNVMNFGVYIAIIIMTIAISIAGFIWIFTPISASQREMAKSTLMNAVIGMVIVLSAWLIVDFVMKTLYNPGTTGGSGGAWGPWNEIIHSKGAGDMCVKESSPSTSPSTNGSGVTTTDNPTTTTTATGAVVDGHANAFAYQTSGVANQEGARSPALISLLNCMVQRVPAGVGKISAITDSHSGTNATTINHCAEVGHAGDSQCAHTVGSCHYGGASTAAACQGQSYAVDFGDENNSAALIAAAQACHAVRAVLEDGAHPHDHVHVSAPNNCGASGGACH